MFSPNLKSGLLEFHRLIYWKNVCVLKRDLTTLSSLYVDFDGAFDVYVN